MDTRAGQAGRSDAQDFFVQTLEQWGDAVVVVDDQGLVTVATGRRVITNGDNTEFLLEGDAQVIREAGTGQDGVARPRLQFNGERLRIFLDPDRVVSDLPVVLRRGNDRLEAATLDYRDNERVADFTGRVRVQLQPAGRNTSPP